ncbi:DmsC/YnfH family molybdoenzyme membrane anchor subunit [Adlercreutzia agrestimuris]|uniref:DmsC/YnfH family molybdoenzyme membrane anchor subunit n=1 Tax=Adlercreutzia agrestimuris TaxID=2941324 RepID=UPI0023B9F57E|nr:DmsC/YnfH family molybdoenzyme membrane anchor subunit [Adlercreutzia agrestimuris]
MISELPLLLFTVLTGLASGGFVMSTILCLMSKRRQRSWLFSLLCLILLGLGMLCVLAHLGHPERFLNALANPTAMITQEAYWSIPFGCLLLADILLLKLKHSENIAIPIIGSLFGLGLMCVTSIAYFTSYGVAGWPEVPTLFLFSIGDLAMGAVFALTAFEFTANHADKAAKKNKSTQSFSLLSILLNLALVLTFIAEAIVFANLAVGPWGFIVAALLTAAATAMQACVVLGKFRIKNLNLICSILITIAVIITRYAFYAMY